MAVFSSAAELRVENRGSRAPCIARRAGAQALLQIRASARRGRDAAGALRRRSTAAPEQQRSRAGMSASPPSVRILDGPARSREPYVLRARFQVCGRPIVRRDGHQLGVGRDVRLDDASAWPRRPARRCGRSRWPRSASSARRRGLRAVVDRRNGTRRHAGAAVDALVGMDVEHRRGLELRLVLAGVDAVDRADIDAGVSLVPMQGSVMTNGMVRRCSRSPCRRSRRRTTGRSTPPPRAWPRPELARASSPMMIHWRTVKQKTIAAARKYIFTQK